MLNVEHEPARSHCHFGSDFTIRAEISLLEVQRDSRRPHEVPRARFQDRGLAHGVFCCLAPSVLCYFILCCSCFLVPAQRCQLEGRSFHSSVSGGMCCCFFRLFTLYRCVAFSGQAPKLAWNLQNTDLYTRAYVASTPFSRVAS